MHAHKHDDHYLDLLKIGICLHCVASTVHVATLCAFFWTIFFLLSVWRLLEKKIKKKKQQNCMLWNVALNALPGFATIGLLA